MNDKCNGLKTLGYDKLSGQLYSKHIENRQVIPLNNS